MIQAICTCGERYDLRDDLAGRKMRCFTCSELFYVPGRPATDLRGPRPAKPDGVGLRPAARALPRGQSLVTRLLKRGGALTAGVIGGGGLLAVAVAWASSTLSRFGVTT